MGPLNKKSNAFTELPEALHPEKEHPVKIVEVSREAYFEPTREGHYSGLQYIIEAEYVVPAWMIVLGSMFFFGYQSYSALMANNGAINAQFIVRAFPILFLPVILAFFSFMITTVETLNETDVEVSQTKSPTRPQILKH